ncbi:hypothetical protein Y032_0197g1573 [Ancylostoma ceylanicum]|uniref:Uncharacterized protein n=1 Tax=Ancylostoma ceylanicum TaxID=53326 RepID=A0A016SP53_9BILA|nr:hypothetical protein Y032_0197g1573 [Ancylostoma ceylanicum]
MVIELHQSARILANCAPRNLWLALLIRATFGTASFSALININLERILYVHLVILYVHLENTMRVFITPETVVKYCFCSCFAQRLRAESVHLAAEICSETFRERYSLSHKSPGHVCNLKIEQIQLY